MDMGKPKRVYLMHNCNGNPPSKARNFAEPLHQEGLDHKYIEKSKPWHISEKVYSCSYAWNICDWDRRDWAEPDSSVMVLLVAFASHSESVSLLRTFLPRMARSLNTRTALLDQTKSLKKLF